MARRRRTERKFTQQQVEAQLQQLNEKEKLRARRLNMLRLKTI